MKQIVFISFLLLFFSVIEAQTVYAMPQKDYLQLMKKFKTHYPKTPKDSLLFAQMLALNPKAKFLYETEKGKVHALPLDNMRCLVPNFHSNMPINKTFPNNLPSDRLKKIKPAPIPNLIPDTPY